MKPAAPVTRTDINKSAGLDQDKPTMMERDRGGATGGRHAHADTWSDTLDLKGGQHWLAKLTAYLNANLA